MTRMPQKPTRIAAQRRGPTVSPSSGIESRQIHSGAGEHDRRGHGQRQVGERDEVRGACREEREAAEATAPRFVVCAQPLGAGETDAEDDGEVDGVADEDDLGRRHAAQHQPFRAGVEAGEAEQRDERGARSREGRGPRSAASVLAPGGGERSRSWRVRAFGSGAGGSAAPEGHRSAGLSRGDHTGGVNRAIRFCPSHFSGTVHG